MPSSQHPTTTRALLRGCVIVLGLLGGCGLKGPLYLPGEKPSVVNKLPGTDKRTSRPSPQSQKKERDIPEPPSGETSSPPAPSGTDRPEAPPPGH